MPAQNPSGSQKYWFNGLPFQGVKKAGTDTDTLTYWFNGSPEQALFPDEAVGDSVVTWAGAMA
jgi:hypothetical protein